MPTEVKTKKDEAENERVDKLGDKSPERGKNETEKDKNEEKEPEIESEINTECKAGHCSSLYLAFSHLINLANNLGCVQRSATTPENKVGIT